MHTTTTRSGDLGDIDLFFPTPTYVVCQPLNSLFSQAHTTLVCGKNGGGIAEVYGIEDQIDICVGTLSKATGCIGGFIACSKKWKKLIQGRGRPYIFTTASPLPTIAACYGKLRIHKLRSLPGCMYTYIALRERILIEVISKLTCLSSWLTWQLL